MRRILNPNVSLESEICLEQLALEQNTLTTDPASPLYQVQLPASGAAFQAYATKANIIGDTELVPFEVVANVPAEGQPDIDEVEETVAVADQLTDLAEAAAAQESLSEGEFRAFQLAAEALCAAVGFSDPRLALESTSTALTTDQDNAAPGKPVSGAEVSSSIREKVKRVWEAIVAALKRARLWLRDHLRTLFDSSAALMKKSDALKAEALGVKTGALTTVRRVAQKSSGIMPNTILGLKHNLHVSGEWPKGGSIVNQAVVSTKLITAYLARYESESLYNGNFVQLLSSADVTHLVYDPDKERSVLELKGHSTHGDGLMEKGTYSSDAMLGGYRIQQQILPKAEGAQALEHLLHTPKLVQVDGDRVNLADIYLMTAPGVVPLAEAAKHLAQTVSKFRDLQTKLDKMVAELIQAAEKAVKNQHVLDDTVEEPKAFQARQKYLRAGPRIFVSEPAAAISYALRTAHWLLTLGDLSLTHADAPAKAEE